MVKSIKKAQQEINSLNVTKKNIECWMNFKTLEECVEAYKHRYDIPKKSSCPYFVNIFKVYFSNKRPSEIPNSLLLI